MKKHFLRIGSLLVVGLALGGLMAGTEVLVHQHNGKAESDIIPAAGVQIGGDFTLTNHKGERVTADSWPGQYTLVFFGFTHCPDVCPLGLNTITDALNELPDSKVEKITPLFITVDPARDTVEEMADYVSLFHPKLVGLTGTRDELEHVAQQYRVYTEYAETPVEPASEHHDHAEGEPEMDHGEMDHSAHIDADAEPMITVNHSAFTYLMAPSGELIDTFSSSVKADEMATKLNDLVKE